MSKSDKDVDLKSGGKVRLTLEQAKKLAGRSSLGKLAIQQRQELLRESVDEKESDDSLADS